MIDLFYKKIKNNFIIKPLICSIHIIYENLYLILVNKFTKYIKFTLIEIYS